MQRIVADNDSIVRVARFKGWQNAASGEREVQKSLQKALLRCQLHKDQTIFHRASGYIKDIFSI